MAQSRPKTPGRKKTHRQLVNESTPAMNGGAMTAPSAVPAFMMPIASERSCTGNHSETALVAAGKPPPSPMPRRKRLAISMPRASGKTVAGASERPPQHDEQETGPCAEQIKQSAPAGVHGGVRNEERRLQLRKGGIRDRDIALNRGDRDRKGLPVKIAERNGKGDQDSDMPAVRDAR